MQDLRWVSQKEYRECQEQAAIMSYSFLDFQRILVELGIIQQYNLLDRYDIMSILTLIELRAKRPELGDIIDAFQKK